jgi:hypothetical protein
LDTEEASLARSSAEINRGLHQQLLELLESTMRRCNPFAEAYEMMQEVDREEQRSALQQNRPAREVQLMFDNDRRKPDRRYAAPRCNEVAAIIIGSDVSGFPAHSLAVRSRSAGLKLIPVINADCDPMSYPLMFPLGTKGFHPDLKRENDDRRKVSMLEVSLKHFKLLFISYAKITSKELTLARLQALNC